MTQAITRFGRLNHTFAHFEARATEVMPFCCWCIAQQLGTQTPVGVSGYSGSIS